MEVLTTSKLKLQMNRFRKRQEIRTPCPPKTTVSSGSSSSPCSCACWKEVEALQKQVHALCSKMLTYDKVIRDFEEIREEIFGEIGIKGDGIQVDEIFKDVQEPLELGENGEEEDTGYSLEGLSETFSTTEVKNEQEHVDVEFKSGKQAEDFLDCVILDSMSLVSSSPALISLPSVPLTDNIVQNNQELAPGNLENAVSFPNQNGDRTERNIKRNRLRSSRTKRTASNPDTLVLPSPYKGPLVCPHCTTGRVYKGRGSLNRHMKHFHTSVREMYVCTPCNKTFQYKEGLTYHTRSVHQGIRYHCGVVGCGSAYSTITALRKHQRLAGHTGDSQTIHINHFSSNTSYRPDQ